MEKQSSGTSASDIDAPYRLLNQDILKITENHVVWRSLVRKLKPELVHETFGGFGRMTKVIQKLWPGVPHEVWERDESCFLTLEQTATYGVAKGVKVHLGDYPLEPLPPKTLLVMDASVFTLKHWATYAPYFGLGAEWVVITDMARGKYHIHPEAYGCQTKAWEEYVSALGAKVYPYGYKVESWLPTPRSITYFLLSK